MVNLVSEIPFCGSHLTSDSRRNTVHLPPRGGKSHIAMTGLLVSYGPGPGPGPGPRFTDTHKNVFEGKVGEGGLGWALINFLGFQGGRSFELNTVTVHDGVSVVLFDG